LKRDGGANPAKTVDFPHYWREADRRMGVGGMLLLGFFIPYTEGKHHARMEVFGDVAVQHPVAGVGHVDEDVHRRADGHDGGVFPDEVGVFHPIHLQHQVSLPVQVDGVVHRVERLRVVEEANLDDVAGGEVPVDVHVFLPCIQVTCLPVDSQFIIGIASFHSMGGT